MAAGALDLGQDRGLPRLDDDGIAVPAAPVVGRDAAAAVVLFLAEASQQVLAGQTFGPCTTIGVIRNRILLGGVVFHEYQPHYRSIMVSYAFDRPSWLTREVLTSLCVYAFIQEDVQRICTLAPKKNKRSRRLVEFIGFKLEGCARKGYGNDDAMIYGMLKHECRWIQDEQTPARAGPRRLTRWWSLLLRPAATLLPGFPTAFSAMPMIHTLR